MIVELDEFLKLFAKKYEKKYEIFERWQEYPKIMLYSDGSGHIEIDGRILFDFDNLEELLAHLNDEEPKPSY